MSNPSTLQPSPPGFAAPSPPSRPGGSVAAGGVGAAGVRTTSSGWDLQTADGRPLGVVLPPPAHEAATDPPLRRPSLKSADHAAIAAAAAGGATGSGGGGGSAVGGGSRQHVHFAAAASVHLAHPLTPPPQGSPSLLGGFGARAPSLTQSMSGRTPKREEELKRIALRGVVGGSVSSSAFGAAAGGGSWRGSCGASEQPADREFTLRERVRAVFDQTAEMPSDAFLAASQAVAWLLFVLIFVSVLFICLESLPANHESDDFFWMDGACSLMFTADLVARAATTPSLHTFARDPLNWVDLLSVLPFYVQLAVASTGVGVEALSVLRLFRTIRVLRVMKLGRYSKPLQIVVYTLKNSGIALGLLGFFLTLCSIFYSCLMFLAETTQGGQDFDEARRVWVRDDGTDSPFQSIFHVTWWAMATLTTVGYGDEYPVTTAGKLVGGAAVITGTLVLAFPVILISHVYTEVLEEVNALKSGSVGAQAGAAFGADAVSVDHQGLHSDAGGTAVWDRLDATTSSLKYQTHTPGACPGSAVLLRAAGTSGGDCSGASGGGGMLPVPFSPSPSPANPSLPRCPRGAATLQPPPTGKRRRRKRRRSRQESQQSAATATATTQSEDGESLHFEGTTEGSSSAPSPPTNTADATTRTDSGTAHSRSAPSSSRLSNLPVLPPPRQHAANPSPHVSMLEGGPSGGGHTGGSSGDSGGPLLPLPLPLPPPRPRVDSSLSLFSLSVPSEKDAALLPPAAHSHEEAEAEAGGGDMSPDLDAAVNSLFARQVTADSIAPSSPPLLPRHAEEEEAEQPPAQPLVLPPTTSLRRSASHHGAGSGAASPAASALSPVAAAAGAAAGFTLRPPTATQVGSPTQLLASRRTLLSVTPPATVVETKPVFAAEYPPPLVVVGEGVVEMPSRRSRVAYLTVLLDHDCIGRAAEEGMGEGLRRYMSVVPQRVRTLRVDALSLPEGCRLLVREWHNPSGSVVVAVECPNEAFATSEAALNAVSGAGLTLECEMHASVVLADGAYARALGDAFSTGVISAEEREEKEKQTHVLLPMPDIRSHVLFPSIRASTTARDKDGGGGGAGEGAPPAVQDQGCDCP
eukprot:Rhum_TRINITY_DN14788_c26_g1::Rhum_TRINITY_DN14788_c26_g1_i1::g.119237::m.119237